MSELETTILDAALRVFARYGVNRSSMADLSKEAGVSRQTLYNRFRNKGDILRGLIGHYTDQAIAEIVDELDNVNDLGDRLDLIFDRMVLRGYDIVQAMPNAEDFIDGINAVSQEALALSGSRFRQVIVGVLAPHDAALAKAGLDVEQLADCLQRSAKAVGPHAQDRADLLTHLRTLRQLCLSATQTDETRLKRNSDHDTGA